MDMSLVNRITIPEGEVNAIYCKRLPDEYQEVEYVTFNGAQYVDTGVIPTLTKKLRVEGGVSTTRSATEMNVIGFNNGSLWQLQSGFSGATNKFGVYSGKTASITTTSSLYNRKIEYSYEYDDSIADKIKLWIHNIDGGRYGTSDTISRREWGSRSLTFGSSGIPPTTLYANVYEHRIYIDGELVGDFVPCYKKSNTTIGFYDTVTNTFKTKLGSGSLTKGSDVPGQLIWKSPNA